MAEKFGNIVLSENPERKPPIDSVEKRKELPDASGEFFPDSIELAGGSYGDLKKQDDRQEKEVHHIPADSVSPLDKADGPAIIMDKEDHRETGSCGNSKEAQEYREKQQKLIEEGKFREAFEMDVEDIRDKFGDKYDEAILEAEEYLDKLESEGKLEMEEKS